MPFLLSSFLEVVHLWNICAVRVRDREGFVVQWLDKTLDSKGPGILVLLKTTLNCCPVFRSALGSFFEVEFFRGIQDYTGKKLKKFLSKYGFHIDELVSLSKFHEQMI